ncbi:MAG: tetratricopeptide repeat protein [Bacteroidia bacterium]
MKFYNILILLSISLFFQPALGIRPQAVSSLYHPIATVQQSKQALDFWQKRAEARPQESLTQIKLGQVYSQLFDFTADISYLKKSEASYLKALKSPLLDPAGVQRALAKNYISQHRFCEALDMVMLALEVGSNKRASTLMLFDVYAELGFEEEQQAVLADLSQKKDFDYLIRWAKWEDGQGRLENTLVIMHEAEAIAEASKQPALLTWTYSNMGDYYGHAGDIAQSEAYYIKSLQQSPTDWYSLKGLAWIAYSYERDAPAALAILKHISNHCKDPGVALLRAEIMEYKEDYTTAQRMRDDVEAQVSGPRYGRMYASFLVNYYIQTGHLSKSMDLAKAEVQQRAVPVAYDMLARVYFAKNNIRQAQDISQIHIWHQTFEPGILINQLRYFEGDPNPYILHIEEEVKGATYELGPLAYHQLLMEQATPELASI